MYIKFQKKIAIYLNIKLKFTLPSLLIILKKF